MAKLKDTVVMLSRLKGLPQFDWMAETLAEIETKMHLNNHTESIIGFEGNEYLQGLDHLETLFNYILSKQSIELTYQPFGKPVQVLTLHPYYIKQHNSRWFLLAEDADSGNMMTLALDRIQGIEPSHVAYRETDIDFSEYFDDVIGVSIPQGKEPEHVLLRFASSRLPYVLSKPLHPSQKAKDKQQGLIEITVIPNRELEAQIWGTERKVHC
jgi:predicted DNA-binding transcriptional regulator YafY